MPDQTGRVAVVTGGNTGIGYYMCKHLALKGAKVYMASRSKERATEAISKIESETQKKVEFLHLELQDLSQVAAAGKELIEKEKKIDILINNAGIMACPFALTKDGWETQFATNHLGHFKFTTTLLPSLLEGNKPRVVNVSSSAHHRAPTVGIDFENINNPHKLSNYERYGQSKLANILFSRGLNARYGDRIIVNSVHPGGVNTELLRGMYESMPWLYAISWLVSSVLYFIFLTPEQGSLSALYAATSPEVEEKGYKARYMIPYGVVCDEVNPHALDDTMAEKLWTFSESICDKY